MKFYKVTTTHEDCIFKEHNGIYYMIKREGYGQEFLDRVNPLEKWLIETWKEPELKWKEITEKEAFVELI